MVVCVYPPPPTKLGRPGSPNVSFTRYIVTCNDKNNKKWAACRRLYLDPAVRSVVWEKINFLNIFHTPFRAS